MSSSSNYNFNTLDWRTAIQVNNQKAFILFVCFFFVYLLFGLTFDLAYYLIHFDTTAVGYVFGQLIALKLFPKITLIMLVLAVLSIFLAATFYDSFILAGTVSKRIKMNTQNTLHETTLYNIVDEMSIAASLLMMPQIYVIEANFMNAFACGYSQDTAMIVVTRGLIEKLNRSELEAVIAHEICYIKDMNIRLVSITGLLANLMLLIVDVFWYTAKDIYKAVAEYTSGYGSQEGALAITWLTLILLLFFFPFVVIILIMRIILPPINTVLLRYLNRTREYFADTGAVHLIRNNEPLIMALTKIQQDYLANSEIYTEMYGYTFFEKLREDSYIYYPEREQRGPIDKIINLYLSHPTIEDRLIALGGEKN